MVFDEKDIFQLHIHCYVSEELNSISSRLMNFSREYETIYTMYEEHGTWNISVVISPCPPGLAGTIAIGFGRFLLVRRENPKKRNSLT